MATIFFPVMATLGGLVRSRAVLHFAILTLRQQLAMVYHTPLKRLRFGIRERLFWIWLYHMA